MKGFKGGIRLAVVGSTIALLALTIPGVATAGSDKNERDSANERQSEGQELNRSLNHSPAASVEKTVEGKEQDRAGVKSSTHEGSPSRGIAERRGRLERLDSTDIGLELGGSNDDQESGVIAGMLICHKPETPAEKTMLVPEQAVPGHLGHGDFLGACDGNETEVAP